MTSSDPRVRAVAPAEGAEPALPVGRQLPARSLAFDIAFAAGLTLVCLPWSGHTLAPVQSAADALPFILALGVAVALRRRFALGAACLAWGVGALQLAFGLWLIVPGDGLLLVSLYSVNAFARRPAGAIATGLTLLGSIVSVVGVAVFHGYRLSDPSIVITFTGMVALTLAAWALGRFRSGLRLVMASQQRAAQLTDLDRERVEQLATAAERARIAREMHDIVAHSLSIVIAQADGGRYKGLKDPTAAISALETISQTGRAALADMRRILGVLRQDESDAELAPQPDATSLSSLVSSVRAAGLEVSYVTLGVERTLPPGMGLAVYRVCQEALTNAMKHAGPHARVTVQVQWLAARVTLEVQDDGRGAAAESDHAGQGLTGMRQRAEMFGGTLQAGPRPGGGFRVYASWPTPPAPSMSAIPAAAPLASPQRHNPVADTSAGPAPLPPEEPPA